MDQGPVSPHDGRSRAGVTFAAAAFLFWAACVFYFKAVAEVPALEVLAHRVIWSALLLLGLVTVRGRLPELALAVRRRRVLLALCCSTVLIAVNWFTFIWAVGHERILDTSLGYFICPLVNVLLGFVFLRERLRRFQVLAVALAAAGVAIMGLRLGNVPLISLVLAFSFGTYGLIRKQVGVGGVLGLTIETGLLAPLAAAFLLLRQDQGLLAFTHRGTRLDLLLLAAGPITALPLTWYVAAARRLRYATLGLMQYLVPSLTFLMAIFLFDEPFSVVRLLSFGFIWVALILYTVDSVNEARGRRPRGRPDIPPALAAGGAPTHREANHG